MKRESLMTIIFICIALWCILFYFDILSLHSLEIITFTLIGGMIGLSVAKFEESLDNLEREKKGKND